MHSICWTGQSNNCRTGSCMADQAKTKEDVLDIMDVDETNEQIKAFVA